jgi:hypothetical protein
MTTLSITKVALFVSSFFILCDAAMAQPNPPVTGPWTSGNPGQSSSTCPKGNHVVGINVQGSPTSTKYCIGCVVKLQVVCEPDH